MQFGFGRRFLSIWKAATSPRRMTLAVLTLSCLLMALWVINYIRFHPDHLIYLPVYLIFIYLFYHSWQQVIGDPGRKEHIYLAIGFSLVLLRYPLHLTPLDPYLDILTVSSFFFFAFSQALMLQKARWLRLSVVVVFIASLTAYFFLLLYNLGYLNTGGWSFGMDQAQIETMASPIWFLASVGLFILFLLDFYLYAFYEVDDFTLHLRLAFLIASSLLFLAFFLLERGMSFDWFDPIEPLNDIVLLLLTILIGIGLAMPAWLEKFFIGLTFLDRRTSREFTLFVLTQIARHTTGSALTALAVHASERAGLNRQDQRVVFLACEFLETVYPGAIDSSTGDTNWERLAVTSIPEKRRLSMEQRLVFSAWRLKRAIEQKAPGTSPPAQIVMAARDYLLDVDLRARGHSEEIIQAVEAAAVELEATPGNTRQRNTAGARA